MQWIPRGVTLTPVVSPSRIDREADDPVSGRRSAPGATLLSLLAALGLAAVALHAVTPAAPTTESAATTPNGTHRAAGIERAGSARLFAPSTPLIAPSGTDRAAYTLVLTATEETAEAVAGTPDDGHRIVFVVDTAEREDQALAVLAHLNAFAAEGASVVDQR